MLFQELGRGLRRAGGDFWMNVEQIIMMVTAMVMMVMVMVTAMVMIMMVTLMVMMMVISVATRLGRN